MLVDFHVHCWLLFSKRVRLKDSQQKRPHQQRTLGEGWGADALSASPAPEGLPKEPLAKEHPLVKGSILRLVAWKTIIAVKQYLSNLCKQLYLSRISKMVSQIIARVRRESYTSSFESPGESELTGILRRKLIQFFAIMSQSTSLHFLGELFQAGYEHGTTRLHRSLISEYHAARDGEKLGVHSQVCNLVKRVFNSKHLQPKHCLI